MVQNQGRKEIFLELVFIEPNPIQEKKNEKMEVTNQNHPEL